MPWPTTYPFFHVDQPEQVDNAALLRRLFGVFLLFVGVSELRFKTRGSA